MIKPPERDRTEEAPSWDRERIGRLLALAYAGDADKRLRPEEARKAELLPGVLREAIRLVPTGDAARRAELVVVDAAAGRAPVTIALAAALPSRRVRFVAIERDASRLAAAQEGFARAIASGEATLEGVVADVGEESCWPRSPALVVAVHACGDATDRTLERAIAASARHVLVVPCCVARSLPSAERAERLAVALGYARSGQLRRRFRDLHTLAERALVLESEGYETDIVAICPESVSPYNLALRASRVGEPVRARRARQELARLRER